MQLLCRAEGVARGGEAVANAARKLHDPKLTAALDSFAVYPETALVGRLQSGQLDAMRKNLKRVVGGEQLVGNARDIAEQIAGCRQRALTGFCSTGLIRGRRL